MSCSLTIIISSGRYFVDSVRYYTQIFAFCKYSFTSCFPICIPFILFPFLIALSRTCSTLLERGGENKINKIDKPLAKLNKRKKRIQEIKGDITNDATKIQRINLKACLIPLYLHILWAHKMPFLRNWRQG